MPAMQHSRTDHPANESGLFFGSRTDVGCVRDHNEDSLIASPPLFAVADGMGGHAAGEVASEIAVQTLAQQAPKRLDGEALSHAVQAANDAILQAACDGVGRQGMGTTLTAAMIENERLLIAQVGDSRAYLLHNGALQQITRDHSFVADMVEAGRLTAEEARFHPKRSIITRALGSAPHTQPDLYELNAEAGDRLLLCSDGLSGMLFDDEIEHILAQTADPQTCADRLVSAALEAGGHDNVTVIVADIAGFSEAPEAKATRKTARTIAIAAIVAVMLIVGCALGLRHWTNTVAYLAEEDGKVAVYQGVPGSFLGMELSRLEQVTDTKVADLNPGLAARLQDEGVATNSLEEALDLADEYALDAARNREARGESGESPAEGDAS